MKNETSKEDNIAYLRGQRDFYRDKADKVRNGLSIEHYTFTKLADYFERELKQAEKEVRKIVKPKKMTPKEIEHCRGMIWANLERAEKIEDKSSDAYKYTLKAVQYFERKLAQ